MLKSLYGTNYSECLGTTIISFKNEKNVTVYRLIALALLISQFVSHSLAFAPWGMLTYFTNWTLEMTTLFVLGSLYCSRNPDNKSMLAVTHIAFQASMFMNLIVVVVYWSFIHAEEVKLYEGIGKVHLYTVHSIPSLSFLINWACTDVVLCASHRIGLTAFGITYAIINCI